MIVSNKTEVIRARVTPVERRALELIARQEALKVSEALRQVIRLDAQRRGLWPVQIEGNGGRDEDD